MGWRFSKSINLRPLRINLSSKGIGVSVGVKGLRVGTGPSGTHIRAGVPGTGISYVKRIGNKLKKRS